MSSGVVERRTALLVQFGHVRDKTMTPRGTTFSHRNVALYYYALHEYECTVAGARKPLFSQAKQKLLRASAQLSKHTKSTNAYEFLRTGTKALF
jgi:hypothetical protein